jgi:hypothetical protein
MDLEGQVARAITEELERQADSSGGELRVVVTGGTLRVGGAIDLEALAMAVVGAVAGGP